MNKLSTILDNEHIVKCLLFLNKNISILKIGYHLFKPGFEVDIYFCFIVIKKDDKVREKSMFGSDYWVVSKEGQLNKNQKKFLDIVEKAAKDKDWVNDLCRETPKKFLFDVAKKIRNAIE